MNTCIFRNTLKWLKLHLPFPEPAMLCCFFVYDVPQNNNHNLSSKRISAVSFCFFLAFPQGQRKKILYFWKHPLTCWLITVWKEDTESEVELNSKTQLCQILNKLINTYCYFPMPFDAQPTFSEICIILLWCHAV